MSVFVVPASGADVPGNYFEFQLGDVMYRLPLMQYLPAAAAEYLEDPLVKRSGEYTFVRNLIAKIDPDLGKVIATLSRDQLMGVRTVVDTGRTNQDGEPIRKSEIVVDGLHSAWLKASEVSVGESSASASS